MPKRTTLIWVHGMGDSQAGFAKELRETLVKGFAGQPGVADIRHEEIVYEDINADVSEKIRKCDLAIGDVCGKVTLPMVGSLDRYTDDVKDALGDVFPDWLSRGVRLWVFQRFNERILDIVTRARDDDVRPSQHSISLVCHSLGTFITYEYLHWVKDVFRLGVSGFRLDNVFMLAPVIALMKELRLGAAMNDFDLALNNPFSKPWVVNHATQVPATNMRKWWAYRHKLDPFASIVPLKGQFLDHPAWTFDAFHAGPNMHAYTNYVTEFRGDILAKVLRPEVA